MVCILGMSHKIKREKIAPLYKISTGRSAQENDTLAAAADRRQRRGKTVSTDGFRFLIRNESMGVTSPLPVMRRSNGKCARRVQGNICDMP